MSKSFNLSVFQTVLRLADLNDCTEVNLAAVPVMHKEFNDRDLSAADRIIDSVDLLVKTGYIEERIASWGVRMIKPTPLGINRFSLVAQA